MFCVVYLFIEDWIIHWMLYTELTNTIQFIEEKNKKMK